MVYFEGFGQIIQQWYKQFKRHLPWRETSDPYLIWLSEIILQQTRIDQGLAYFNRFAENYPTVEKLAAASEDEVLKLWQGLGYYSRARNLHFTAKTITREFGGQFPKQYSDIIKLKGVGEYTAAAIASISYKQPYAVVDGNVYRVLSRIFGIDTPIDSTEGKKAFKQLAEDLLDRNNPGDHNQAVMEFGAIQCTPKNPNCAACPFCDRCFALQGKAIERLPVKQGKVKIRHRYFNYLVYDLEESTFLTKRTSNDIWKNLYQFPLIETAYKAEVESLHLESELPINNSIGDISEVTDWKKQVLSHQHIHYRFIHVQLKNKKNLPTDLIEVNKKDIFNFAVPKPVEKQLNYLNWF
ncbi:A/G-specific adenine glycosylase [Mangrovibacterium diazotrophicum]|uniref:Adenine DNA glycosylase n=1 Tax=Mangrovibacterium diazotrophicum TaxID=1261403 RepID=A0A419W6H1_9BACT|nr:A/G-specific adenine glycosylase [Mangrovibacterium diazotrophicum]RKD91020.1 A/G-specific DNA-adenine glycosylase [Mangrovibacterium diazotrophicum]